MESHLGEILNAMIPKNFSQKQKQTFYDHISV